MKDIESIKDTFELFFTPQIVMVVPSVWAVGEDVQLEAGNNIEVVTRTLQPSQKIAIADFIDTNESVVGQDKVELPNIVADHVVKTFMAFVTTPKTGTHHIDAIARTSDGNIALVPKVP